MNEVAPDLHFRIRKMELKDLEVVREIDQVSFSQPWPAQSFAFEIRNNPNSCNWVAEAVHPPDQVQVCAMMVVWLVIDEAHIGTIAVHPDYRRKGIAMLVLKHGLRTLQKKGAKTVYLEVRSSNTAAQALYEKLGFSQSGVRKGYYQNNGEDALIYTLEDLEARDFS